MQQLCEALDVDAKQVNWDAATETVEGDVQAVIWNILRARMGESSGQKLIPASNRTDETPKRSPAWTGLDSNRAVIVTTTRLEYPVV